MPPQRRKTQSVRHRYNTRHRSTKIPPAAVSLEEVEPPVASLKHHDDLRKCASDIAPDQQQFDCDNSERTSCSRTALQTRPCGLPKNFDGAIAGSSKSQDLSNSEHDEEDWVFIIDTETADSTILTQFGKSYFVSSTILKSLSVVWSDHFDGLGGNGTIELNVNYGVERVDLFEVFLSVLHGSPIPRLRLQWDASMVLDLAFLGQEFHCLETISRNLINLIKIAIRETQDQYWSALAVAFMLQHYQMFAFLTKEFVLGYSGTMALDPHSKAGKILPPFTERKCSNSDVHQRY
jgi:hypothetical protein